ncbi:MAG: MFS transporter [Planctomycetota bacterium]
MRGTSPDGLANDAGGSAAGLLPPRDDPESAAGPSDASARTAEAPRPAPPHSVPPEIVRASLRASIKDALAWSFMQGAGAGFVAPFVIVGGSQPLRLAALSALPQFGGALVQWFSAHVTDTLGRRNRLIIGSGFIQALTWLPMCLAIFLPAGPAYWVMLASYIGFVGMASISNPPWQSLMGDLIPPDRRGRYFGQRNALSGVVQVAALLGAGWWLKYAGDEPALGGLPLAAARALGLSGRAFGFLLIFALSCVARLISVYYLTQVYEPPYRPKPADRFTLLDFIRRAPKAHFGRFVFYGMIIHSAFGFNGPFLAWYLLDGRQFSTGAYATIMTASLLANLLSQPLWGRLVDRLGSKRVLEIGGIAIIFIPVFFLFCTSFWHFLLVQLYDGFTGAAYGSATSNYLYDVVTPPKRARCVAYNTLFLSFGALAGSFAGATVSACAPLQVAGLVITEPFHLMLVGSALLRLLANVLLLWSFQEFRLNRPVFAPSAS